MANNPLSALFAAQRHAGCTAAPKRGGSESMERDRRLFFGLFSSVFPFFSPPILDNTAGIPVHISAANACTYIWKTYCIVPLATVAG